MRRRSGTSLVEVLVTMVIVSMVLGMVANLCNGYANTLRWATDKDLALAGAQDGVERVSSELATAVQLLEPSSSGVPASRLEFYKVDPTSTTRLPSPLPTTLPSSWDPRDADDLITVAYEVSGEKLRRTTSYPSGTTYTLDVASKVAGFAVEDLGDGTVAVSTSFTSASGVVTTLRTLVAPRALQ